MFPVLHARSKTTHPRPRLAFDVLEDRATPATLTVNSLAGGVLSPNGELDIREAIAVINSGSTAGLTASELAQVNVATPLGTSDTIVFHSSLANSTLTLSGPGELVITKSMTIDGSQAPQLLVSGGNVSRVFAITDSVIGVGHLVTLRALNITGGFSVGAALGGKGGAIYNAENLIVDRCAIDASRADFGGGGGIGNDGALTLVNSTLSGNSADGPGGGVFNAGSMTVTMCTITGNTSDRNDAGAETGGGLATATSGGASTRLCGSIVAGNFRGFASPIDNDLGGANLAGQSIYNLIGNAGSSLNITSVDVNGSNIVGNNGSGTQNIDFILNTTLAFNGGPTRTHALSADSDANTFVNFEISGFFSVPSTDQRGFPYLRNPDLSSRGAYNDGTPPALVVDIATDEDDGNYAAGDLSLREAVRVANENPDADTITFAPSVTTATLTIDHLQLTDVARTTIDGGSDGVTVTRSTAVGTPLFRIFDVFGGTVAFKRLTISNGAGNIAGAGVHSFASAGNVTISDSTITGNASSNAGGGVFNSATMTIVNSTISGNTATGPGGGVHNFGTLTLANVTITGNRARVDDAGADFGGGLGASGAETVRNTLIAGNFLGSSGTTANDIGSSVEVFSNTLVGDAATAGGITNGGGNIVGINGAGTRDIATILNTTLADNGGPTFTHALVAGSPALNAGSNAGVPAGTLNDQRGAPYVRASGTIDIGAFESQSLALVVDKSIDENDGDYSAGDLSLREAVLLANDNPAADSITFDASLTTVVLNSGVQITDAAGLTIDGESRIVLDGNSAGRIFSLTNTASAVLRNLTFQNAATSNASGGGAIVNAGTLTVANSVFQNNSATAGNGGAIRSQGAGSLTITGSTFTGNSASSGGGAIDVGNTATALIANTTISGNSAANNGGGLAVNGTANVTVRNSTIVLNRADSDGSGVGGGGGIVFAGTLSLHNSIVAGNLRGAGAGTSSDIGIVTGGTMNPASSNNLIANAGTAGGLVNGTNGNIVGNNGTGIRPLTTILNSELADNGGPVTTHALIAGSPAIDKAAAAQTGGATTDQRGAPFARVIGAAPDIGAVEFTGSLVVDTLADNNNGNLSAGNLSLREAIAIANAQSGPDTIRFADSLSGQIVLTLGRLVINSSLTIAGPGAGKLSVSGNAATQIFFIDGTSPVTVAIQDLALENGLASGTNGTTVGVFNTAANGGAIANFGGNVTLTRLSVVNNGAPTPDINNGVGGGIMNGPNSTMTVVASTIADNHAGISGGGIYTYTGSTLTIVNSTFSNNRANYNGGAIRNFQGTLSVVGSTIVLNHANNDDAQPVAEYGGGVHSTGTDSFVNTIILRNYLGSGTTTLSDLTLDNIPSLARNNIVTETGQFNFNTGPGNIVGGPSGPIPLASVLDAVLKDNGGPTRTHALIQNSLAIAAASASAPGYSAVDQRGAFRDPTAPDIGAYEVQHPLAAVGVPSTYAETFQPRPSASANEAFVKGLYQSTLLRAPDPVGLASWVAQVNGGASKADIAFGFVNSVENRSNQVTFFYRYFLGRTPDPAGLSGWVSVLQTGADEGTVMSGFLLSPEFTGQNNNESFVNLMYYAILGRPADPVGFGGWVAQLNAGQATRDQVGNGFLRSVESITRVVVADFGSYLKRTVAGAAASGFVTQIQSGVTFGRVAAAMLGSDEFFVEAEQNLN